MFREMRRKNQQMSDEEARDILAAATSGVLALAGENGYPYAVPMSFAYDEEKERLLFHTARVGHKMTAIERCDKASFCIIAEDKVVPHRFLTQYRSVIAFGRLRGDAARLYPLRGGAAHFAFELLQGVLVAEVEAA